MEIYILDELYRRIDVCDVFQSLIWTDRVRSVGDFELILNSSSREKTRFPLGTKLAMNESYRVMVVETAEDITNDQGIASLKISGRSLEKILDSRAALDSLADTTSVPKWVLTGTPADIARQLFHDICVTGTLDAGDIIAEIIEGTILPDDTIPEPADVITYEVEPQSLYSALQPICVQYNMGFRIVRDPVSSLIYFDVYMGSDRTASQTDLDAVIFSPDLENLLNTSKIDSIGLEKNVAYVISPVGFEVVYPLDVDPTISSFERNVLLVNANDITDVDAPTASAKMIQRGLQELAANRRITQFDGEISEISKYKEGRDYYIGDLVEIHDSTGSTEQMQVIEQIHISDEQGERSYPTLSAVTFIAPGTWAAQPADLHWEDVDDSIHWSDEP